MKRILSWLLVLIMLVTMLPTAALAAEQAGVVTLKFRVKTTNPLAYYTLATTATVNKRDSGAYTDSYVLPKLSTLTNDGTYGRVIEIIDGGWVYGGTKQEGASVRWSNNDNSRTITYVVDWYDPDGGPGPSAVPEDAIDLGGSGNNLLVFTVRHHANYPDSATPVIKEQKYAVKSSGTSRFTGANELAKRSTFGFTGYAYLNDAVEWHSSATSDYSWGLSVTNGGTYDAYARWYVAPTTANITFADGISDEENPDDSAELPASGLYPLNEAIDLPTPTRISARGWVYDFLGWTDGTNVYTDTYTVTADATLTAMWQLRTVNGDGVWNYRDAMAIMDHLSGIIIFTNEQLAISDRNSDGTLSFRDAMAIMDVLTGE